jgi:hypothetical protein
VKRFLIVLLLLAPPAMGQAPPPEPAPAAQAVASVRPRFPSGSSVLVDGTGSKSPGGPLSFQIAVRPREPFLFTEGRTGALFPALPDGHYFVAVVARAPRDYAGDPVDVLVLEFQVGQSPPPVKPDVPPDNPKPAPATPIQALGQGYAAADVKAMADTWDESAAMVAAGTAVGDVMKSFGQRWQARRTPAFNAGAGAAFAAIVPPGTEPATQASRDALVAAWKDFAAGLRLGVAK